MVIAAHHELQVVAVACHELQVVAVACREHRVVAVACHTHRVVAVDEGQSGCYGAAMARAAAHGARGGKQ